MANNQIITVTIGTLTNTGTGQVCANPHVKLVGYPNVYINCINENTGEYEVQVPDGLDETSCLQFEVGCNDGDNCDPCDKQIIERCLCTTDDDCGDCQECGPDGYCIDLCDLCVDDRCVDCITDEDCGCNKICDGNGNCVCPQNLFPDPDNPDCCIECNEDTPCEECEVCNSNGFCEPKDCPDGVCSGDECVECVNNEDCSGVNECCQADNTCDCCPGYTRDACTGDCVAIPINSCANGGDCDECENCTGFDPCTGLGTCTPVRCPDGYIAAVVDGVCDCIEECDCANPDCSSDNDYCNDFGEECGCVPCGGDCASGCEAPCYCDPDTQECVASPCALVSCTTGADCGEGCGCDPDTGLCVPCDALSCATSECDEVLGCGCVNGNCEDTDDGCPNIPCSVESDCGDGCTCYQGECISCDNFSCITNDCADQPGCACSGGTCGDDGDDSCADTITIVKDDANCEITGTLVKDNCCQCPVMTLDSLGKLNGDNTSNYVIDFKVEVRKGAWDGVNVNSVPRTDDTSNPDIAENENPTSGTIKMKVVVETDDYDISGGGNVFIGTSSGPLAGYPKTALFSGSSAEVLFSSNFLPKIGTETVDGNTRSVVAKVTVEFELINSLDFPNECEYSADVISTYVISTNTGYTNFPSTYGLGKANTFQSSVCRLPLFKWTKSSDTVFNEEPFRKIYAPLTGTFTYADTFGGTEGLESCFNYLLETDCTCEDAPQQYVVICNPEDLDFSLSNCNHDLTINSFDQCDVNDDVLFRVEAGTINITFTGATAPVGVTYTSDTSIEQVTFSIDCDTEDQCTQIYDMGSSDLEITPDIVCEPDNGSFTVTFPTLDDTSTCSVVSVEIGGFTLTGPFSKELPTGTYTAVVNWACGCDPTEVEVSEDCCTDVVISEISRDCEGTVVCTQDDYVTYTVDGDIVPDICAFVTSLGENEGATIVAQKGDCSSVNIPIAPLGDICCDNFEVLVNPINEELTIVTIAGATANTVVTATNNTTGIDPTVTDNGNNTWNITGYTSGDNLTVTATDPACGSDTETFDTPIYRTPQGPCDLTVAIEQYIESNFCRMRAEATNGPCPCRYGAYRISFSDVSQVGNNLEITYTTSVQNFDADTTAGSLWAGEVGNVTNQGFIEGTSKLIVPLTSTPSLGDCFGVQLKASLLDDAEFGLQTLNIRVVQGSSNLIDNADVATVQVTINGVVATYNETTGIYSSANCCASPADATIVVTVTDNDTNTYEGTYEFENLVTGVGQAAGLNICQTDAELLDLVQVQFSIRDIALEDSCTYQDATETFMVYANGTVIPSVPQLLSLIPDVINGRDIKYVWVRNGSTVFTDFQGAVEGYVSTLPFGETLVGDDYDVEASCGSCNDTDSALLCCLPAITVNSIIGCNLGMNITAVGNPGNYEIVYNAVAYPFTINAGGSATFNVNIPAGMFLDTGAVRSAATPTCTEDFDITLANFCIPAWSTLCTAEATYDITFESLCTNDGTLTVDSLAINSGSGSVNGLTIENVTQGNAPEVVVTVSNSCTITIPSTQMGPDTTCIGYTPTYIPTYTPFNYVPTYTPTYTPASYVPTYTPTYTPASYVPTYTPTAAQIGACCVGGVCTQETEADCGLAGGTWYIRTSCSGGGPCGGTYTPTYTPAGIPQIPAESCIGCTASDGTCCNEIASQVACISETECFWDAGNFCDCKNQL